MIIETNHTDTKYRPTKFDNFYSSNSIIYSKILTAQMCSNELQILNKMYRYAF